jgi:ribosome-associated toxin RatA of RatAB toxin-antitoxin module
MPTMLDASTTIFLTEGERKLVGQGDIAVREIATTNKPGRTFEAIGLINAPRNIILQVLTAYENYPEFMPNVSRIDIVEQRGDETVLNYTLTLPMGKIKKYRLKISLTAHDKQASMLHWQLQRWPGLKTAETIRDTTGYWRIEEKTKNSSLVLYHVYTDPGPIPFGLGWIVDVMSKNTVPEALLQTKARTEKIALRGNAQK